MFSSTSSMSLSTNGFGSRVGFGQSINPNVSSTASSASQYTFGQGSNLFGSAAANNGGTSTGVFGGSSFGQSSNLFGSAAANNGGSSIGVFGQTASSNLFGQSSKLCGSSPNNGGTVMDVTGQAASSSSSGLSSNIFGSVPNNGGTSVGVFGQTTSRSSFGQKSNIFGSVSNNGGTSAGLSGQTASGSSFGFQHTFGSVPTSSGTSMGVFGVTPSPFSSSSSPILWGSSTGSTTFSQVPASIASTSSGFGSSCMTSSDQTTVPWGKNSISGANTFSFGTQSVGEKRGSRVTSYTKTSKVVDNGERNIFVSISAMPAYQNKSHEELRWEDHHQFNAGGSGAVPAVPSNPFSPVTPPSVGQYSSLNPPPPSVQSNPFGTVTPPSIGQNSFLNPTPPSIGQNSFLNPAPPSVPSNPFVTPPSIGQHSFLNPAPPTVPSNTFSTTVTLPSIGQNSFLNPAPPSVPFNPFPTVTPPSIGQHSFLNPAPPSVLPNPFATVTPPSIGQHSFQNPSAPLVPSNPSATVTPPSIGHSPLNHAPPSNPSNPFSTTVTTPSQNTEVKQSPIPSPFGTQSAVPQMTAPPVKYGISSIPVCDKPAPARSPSLLSIRHLSYHRQRWQPLQKYKPKGDSQKVAFFDDAQKTPITAKKEAPLFPRSNPRAFISGLYEELNLRVNFNNTSFSKNSSSDIYENGEVELSSATDQDNSLYQDIDGISSQTDAAQHNCNTDPAYGDHPIKKEISLNVYELMPKLRHSDYFFEPRVEELAIKESHEPGFCSHVKGFVVGRQGYGSIKFLEETDVRELDLESYIEFKNREVIVYMDESKKPPVGQGLNKSAEITLCNIKVIDKKTGKQYVNGPSVDKFKEKLMKKTAEQGAEFLSYNPVQGEWKFRVQHF